MIRIDEIINNKISFKTPCCVYFLIKDNEVIYVGQAVNLHVRLSQHSYNKEFDSFYYIECSFDEMNDLEAKYIVKFKPSYNKNLPPNNHYKSTEQLKEIFGVSKYELNKIIRKRKLYPVMNHYYDITPFLEELN